MSNYIDKAKFFASSTNTAIIQTQHNDYTTYTPLTDLFDNIDKTIIIKQRIDLSSLRPTSISATTTLYITSTIKTPFDQLPQH